MNGYSEGDDRTYLGRVAAVVGAGRSGRAAARLLRRLGARVRVLERDPSLAPEAFLRFARAEAEVEIIPGDHKPEHFQGADMVVMSPGVAPRLVEPLLPSPRPEVIGELELAWRHVKEPILAVTGSNGKTTTVSLAAAMLERAGRTVFLGGNIDPPLSEYAISRRRADVLVLEVSSFQLMTRDMFHPRVGVLLNLAPNHLDYHADMEEYAAAKFSMFARQEPDDLALFPEALRDEVERRKPTRAATAFFEAADRFPDAALAGEHNRENMEAAYRACAFFGVDEAAARAAARDFKPLPHRLESVAEVDGVLFVNDSKATTLESLRAALQSFDRPVLLLAGGVFKGGEPAGLAPLIGERVKAVCLFGAGGEIFEPAWRMSAPVSRDETMAEAFERCVNLAVSGDVVLLSPATSSFDQYANYKARGEDFRRLTAQRARSLASEGDPA